LAGAAAASLLAGLALTAAACGGEESLDLSAADSGAALDVPEGTELVLTLDSNHTTGYEWNLVEEPDPGVLELRSTAYEEPEEPIPGAGGQEVWRFEAVGKGTTSFELGYFQPWEPEGADRVFTVTVTVT
jgi:predicted secreted protein